MITHSLPAFSAVIVIVPPLGLLPSPCRTAFSTSGCSARNGSTTDEHLGRDLQLDVQPVAEAGLLQPDVALDVGQLVRQRGVLARACGTSSG